MASCSTHPKRPARIIGPVEYLDALKHPRTLQPGPCLIQGGYRRGMVRLYVTNARGVEFSYDFFGWYIKRRLETGDIVYDET